MSTPRTKSLGRAVDLLRACASRADGTSASELARVTGLPRSTVARTLRTLADDGFVEKATDGAGWMLGYELVRLARAADPYRRVVEAAQPALLGLRDAAAESALLAVPRGRPGMEIVLQIDAGRQVGVANWVGTDVPLHASAAGKVILAELDADELEEWLGSQQLVAFTESTITDAGVLRAELVRIRQHGWAELVDELEHGLGSMAVPVRRDNGALAGAVGISGPTFRLGRVRRRTLVPALHAAAEEIEAALRR